MLYNALLILFSIGSLPKVCWDRWKKKKMRPTLADRLGLSIPNPGEKPVIWIHAVSVGETKAAAPLFRLLRTQFPNSFFLITHGTATGQDEAKRSMKEADAFAFLPLDFSWIMKRWAKALRPTHFIQIESDFWYHLLKALKKQNTWLILASGKLSKRSGSRFRFFSFFAKKLFGLFDLLCVQNEEHKARFAPFASQVQITGNLKMDLEPEPIDLTPWKDLRGAITIASTHAPEEEALLKALSPNEPLIFLAPRHPDRFDSVEKLLFSLQLPFIRWSQVHQRTGKEKVILVDAMGQLPICYSLSRFAILGGSFFNKVGGHNLLEPCLYGCPVLFGPFTQAQKEFTTKILFAKAGLQRPLSDVQKTVQQLLENPQFLHEMRTAASALFTSNRGAAKQTFEELLKKELGNKEELML